MMCLRCFPAFDSALLSEVVTVLGLDSYSYSSSLYSKSFGSSGQRLQRYIADIHKGILIILVSGGLLCTKFELPSYLQSQNRL